MDGVADDVARAIGDRNVSIPAPYVIHNGCSSAPQENVDFCYDIFLPLDGSGAHYPQARSWGHVRVTKSPEPRFFCFQLLLLMAESTQWFGSQRARADMDAEPNAYWQAVALASLARAQKISIQQTKVLGEMVVCDALIDRRFCNHVEYGARMVREGESPLAAPPVAIPVPRIHWSAYGDCDARWHPGERGPRAWDNVDCGEAVAAAVRASQRAEVQQARAAPARAPPRGGGAKQPPQKRQRDSQTIDFVQLARDLRDKLGGRWEGAVRVPKVTFTVTPILADGARNCKDLANVCGVYCRFLVRDPDMNPSKFAHQVFSNVELRLAERRRGKRTQFGPQTKADLFPQYARLYATGHPAGDHNSKQLYLQCVRQLQGAQVNVLEGIDESFMRYSSDLHLCNVLTPERAMADMERIGRVGLAARVTPWWDSATKTALFPYPEDAPTYVYHPYGVFWYHDRYVGMGEQWFPHVESNSDLVTEILAGGSLDRFVGDVSEQPDEPEQRARTMYEELRDHMRDNWLISRRRVLETTLVTYNTYNEFVHRAAEAKVIQARIGRENPAHGLTTLAHVQALQARVGAQWRQALGRADTERWLRDETPERELRTFEFGPLPYDPLMQRLGAPDCLAERVAQYERYSVLLRKAQEACNSAFVSLFQPEGNVEALPVSEPVRAALHWYNLNHRKLPHMTREFLLFDPELGIFGNSTLRMLKFYVCVGRALQPIVCLLGECTFTAYIWSPGELATNQMLHGRYDVGKTFLAISTLLKMTTIPGTVQTYTTSTAAADTTQRHVYDQIIASDEVQPWKVSKAAADKNEVLVNREKVKLTTRQVGHNVYVNEVGPNGENIRWTRCITTDHYAALVEVTNAVVEDTSPLASRYHRCTVAQPQMAARNQIEEIMKHGLKSDAQLYMQMHQFLTIAVWKAIQCGAIFEPHMQLFKDMSNRVIDTLVSQRATTMETGARRLEIMMPYAKQCVVRYAIHCCYDMPGGENYKQPFDPARVVLVQPYLACTTEIVWWVWTAMSSGWIDEDNSAVVEAACCAAQVDHLFARGAASPYDVYERDLADVVPWRLRDNPHYERQQQQGEQAPPRRAGQMDGDNKLVDLNYITLHGTMEQVCREIADRTEAPRLSWTDVHGILTFLKTHRVPLPGGGYKPQPRATFKRWHRYTSLPDETPEGAAGQKNVDHTGATMPAQYRGGAGDDTSQPRTEAHVPRFGAGTRLPVVDDSEVSSHKRLYIMPHVAHMFRNDKILTALRIATTCASTRPGKMLLGMPDAKNSLELQVFRYNRDFIDGYVRLTDEKNGWGPGMQWRGDSSIPHHERPVPLQLGVPFLRQSIITEADRSVLNAVPPVPVENEAEWRERNEREILNASRARVIFADLDYESARRQHVRCGLPLDAPVRSPQFCIDRMKRECEAAGRPWHGDTDYPHSMLADFDDRRVVWRATEVGLHASLSADAELFAMANQDPRDARVHERRQQRTQQLDALDAAAEDTSVLLTGNSSRGDAPVRNRRRPRARPPQARENEQPKRSRAADAVGEVMEMQ